jgi:hypothetical protein
LKAVVDTNVNGTNSNFEVTYNFYPDFTTIDGDLRQIVIGQAHTYPLVEGGRSKFKHDPFGGTSISFVKEKYNEPGVSYDGDKNDKQGAIDAKFPYYAIQSYDNSGHLYKVDQHGNMNLRKQGRFNTQIPVGNISNLGTNAGQFNILLDSFKSYSGFKK